MFQRFNVVKGRWMGDFHELGWEGVQAENGGMRVPEASTPRSVLTDT